MADEALLQILRQGAENWNKWRLEHGEVRHPDLSGADLYDADLANANLAEADLSNALLSAVNFSGVNLSGADISAASINYTVLDDANLIDTNMENAHLGGSYLVGADLSTATLTNVDLSGADLTNAILRGASLTNTLFSRTKLSGAKFDGAITAATIFDDVDLRAAVGLENIIHMLPSRIVINTIFTSAGKIPEVFLRGCGVPESLIVNIPALIAAMQPIQFYSCFISYSTKDEEFARRLHARMQQEGLRVWFAPEDMKGGDYFSDQIDRAIQVHDRLLLVLSENSMKSNWVIREIKRARKAEEREGRKKLFPISLTSYEVLRGWECLEHDSGLDLAEEVRKYHIPDFSNWKNHDDFEREFNRLYESLKAEA